MRLSFYSGMLVAIATAATLLSEAAFSVKLEENPQNEFGQVESEIEFGGLGGMANMAGGMMGRGSSMMGGSSRRGGM